MEDFPAVHNRQVDIEESEDRDCRVLESYPMLEVEAGIPVLLDVWGQPSPSAEIIPSACLLHPAQILAFRMGH